MPIQQSAGSIKVTIDGTPLTDEMANRLTVALVDGNLNQPDLFSVSFRDQDRQLLKKTNAHIGSKVILKAFSDLSPGGELLITGEVTAVEVEHGAGGTFTVLRGYDESHRLFRGRNTDTYQNMTSSDIATAVAKRAGLTPGQIDSTSPVFDWLAQNNCSDWTFLKGLAQQVGYEVLVEDGKLHFRQPAPSTDAPASGDLTNTTNPLQLTIGAQLLRLHAVVSSSDQVSQVQVRGWDPKAKQSLVGTATAGTKSASTATSPSDLANAFGGPPLASVGRPYSSQTEVDSAAQALAEHVGSSFAELEGVARGNAKLRAGVGISVSLVGDPFDGKYVLTSTRHHYDPNEGYTTAFTVSGANERSLLGMVSGGGGGGGGGTGASGGGGGHVSGVVTAIVTDVDDPQNEGRIKITYPWLSDSYSSDWAPMCQAGAGPKRGAVFLPEVGDEVLVAFDHGDMGHPYVIGSLYNGQDAPVLGTGLIDGTSGAVKRRGIVSKDGHMLVFFDDDSDTGLALISGDKSMKVSLNQGQTQLNITSGGQITIKASSDLTIQSDGDISVNASGTLSLQGASVSISANADVSVSGQPIKLN